MRRTACVRVCTAMLVVALGASTTTSPQATQITDYTTLTGTWEGTFKLRKAGACSIREVDRPVWVTLDVAPDGTFSGSVNYKGPKDEADRRWNGAFDAERRLKAKDKRKSECGGRPGQFQAKYSGKITERDGRLWLEYVARVAPCPGQGCIFDEWYKLTKMPDDAVGTPTAKPVQ